MSVDSRISFRGRMEAVLDLPKKRVPVQPIDNEAILRRQLVLRREEVDFTINTGLRNLVEDLVMELKGEPESPLLWAALFEKEDPSKPYEIGVRVGRLEDVRQVLGIAVRTATQVGGSIVREEGQGEIVGIRPWGTDVIRFSGRHNSAALEYTREILEQGVLNSLLPPVQTKRDPERRSDEIEGAEELRKKRISLQLDGTYDRDLEMFPTRNDPEKFDKCYTFFLRYLVEKRKITDSHIVGPPTGKFLEIVTEDPEFSESEHIDRWLEETTEPPKT